MLSEFLPSYGQPFVILTQIRIIWEEEHSVQEMPLLDRFMGKCVCGGWGDIFFSDWCREVWLTVRSATTWLVLDYIRNQEEPAVKNKPESSHLCCSYFCSCLSTCLDPPQWQREAVTGKRNKLFSPKLILVMVFTATESKVGHSLRAKMLHVNYFDKRKDHPESHGQECKRSCTENI